MSLVRVSCSLIYVHLQYQSPTRSIVCTTNVNLIAMDDPLWTCDSVHYWNLAINPFVVAGQSLFIVKKAAIRTKHCMITSISQNPMPWAKFSITVQVYNFLQSEKNNNLDLKSILSIYSLWSFSFFLAKPRRKKQIKTKTSKMKNLGANETT